MIVVGEGKTNIPIRSLWLLLIYASDMLGQFRTAERQAILAGRYDAELVDPIAEVLVGEVEKRLRQQLSFHYRRRSADLSRVRGRVNHLRTASNRLMEQGRIACVFEELSVDSPRNRFIAATLLAAHHHVRSSELRHRCASTAFKMHRLGVSPRPPSRPELSTDRLSNNDAADRRMLDAAHLLHDMGIPTHQSGQRVMPRLAGTEGQYRVLFQKAVRNYFEYTLDPHRWTVAAPQLRWLHHPDDPGAKLLPVMQTDTVLHDRLTDRRIVIEMKFADALIDSRFGDGLAIKSEYLYQLYGYVMSQSEVGHTVGEDKTEGVLLFVRVERREAIDTVVNIQGHRIRFLSVDFAGDPSQIRECWRRCLADESL
jgi:5-methylcytosine-specific restriction enzyme subunit McrC